METITVQTTNGNQTPGFVDLLEEYTYERPQQGQILEGVVLRVANDALFIDVGGKRDAIVPHTELDRLGEDFLEGITAGDELPVYVMRTPVGDEQLFVSLEKGLQKEDWDRAVTLRESGELVELEVTGYNKGGILVKFSRLEGFVPNSHVPSLKRVFDSRAQQAEKAKLVGEVLPVKVLDVEQDRQRLVFSAKAAHKLQRRQQLEALEPGAHISGEVTAIVKFGAFVDLGHVDGLIHISKLDHEHVNHPSEVLEVGEEVEVLIEEVDVKRERVSLNRRALLPSPWQLLPQQHQVGDLVEGTIDNVVDFGAFIRLDSGVVGLAHVSELNLPAGIRPVDRFQEGDTLLARIIEMEPERERLSLSLRRVSMREELNWMSERAGRDEVAEAAAPETESEDAEPAQLEAAETIVEDEVEVEEAEAVETEAAEATA